MVAADRRPRKQPITDAYRLPPSVIGRKAAARDRVAMSDRLLVPLFILLWSSGYVVGAAAVGVADPLPLLAARFLLASLVAAPVVILRNHRWRQAPLGRLAVAGLLLHVV